MIKSQRKVEEKSRSFLVQVLGVTDKAASQEIIKNYRNLAQQVKENCWCQ